MLIRLPRPHRRVVKSLGDFTEVNRWASDLDLRIQEILRSLEDVQRVINNITVTNAPATFIVSSCSTQIGADSGCFRKITLTNDSSVGALLKASSTFTVNAISLQPPTGSTALIVDSTAVRRTASDFAALTQAKGYVMFDSANYWRLAVTTDGIPFFHNTGTSAP